MRFSLAFVLAVAALAPIVHAGDEAQKAPLPVKESLAKMKVPEGFKVSLFAGEPDVVQPVAFDFDDRGRLWVAEFLSYPKWAATGNDRIVIFEDTNNDGVFDTRKVFWDKGNYISGLTVGFGGVYVASSPNLLFIPDANSDDAPDGEPQVLLDGWSTKGVHNAVCTLTWGLDGWLYGANGITSPSKVGKPGAEEKDRVDFNCGMWRFHPLTKEFEVVMHGTTNPWGIDFNADGEIFMTNNVIGHFWHVVPGAHFKRMFGNDFNPNIYDLIEMCADHLHWAGGSWTSSRGGVGAHSDAGGGHSHAGLMIYQGDNWPEQYRGKAFMSNTHGNRINMDILERKGSGYVAKHGADFMFANDKWFRGTAIKYGPDGGVYVADWNQGGECHTGSQKDTGRIWKITYGDAKPWNGDLQKLSNAELVALHTHKNEWFTRKARRILQERTAAGKLDAATATTLREMYDKGEPQHKMRALATIFALGADVDLVFSRLNPFTASEQEVVWLIRALAQKKQHVGLSAKVTALASLSPRVRLHLASLLQKLNEGDRWDTTEVLAKVPDDVSDPYIPLMLWYGLEPLVVKDPARALKIAGDTPFPTLREFIPRRLAVAGDDWSGIIALLKSKEDLKFRQQVLQGFAAALKGRRDLKVPTGWAELSPALISSPNKDVCKLAVGLALQFGDTAALEFLKKRALDAKVPAEERTVALEALLSAKAAGTSELLQGLLGDTAVRAVALRGLAAFDEPAIAQKILELYPTLTALEKNDAVNTLSARRVYAQALVKALKENKIPRADVSAYAARLLESLGDADVSAWLKENWGVSRPAAEETLKELKRYKDIAAKADPAKNDASRGRAVFKKTCASCHVLFDDGGNVGPNLTGSGRVEAEYVLQNLLDPNALVAQDYLTWIVKTKDGRVLSGLIRSETDQTVTVATATEALTLPKSEIASRKQSQQSMMPEGLLQQMSEQELLDLLTYLKAPGQVPVK